MVALDHVRRSLQTLESQDPRELRMNALEVLQRFAAADDVSFLQFRRVGDTIHYASPLASSELGRRVFASFEGRVGYDSTRHQVNPRPAEVNRFIGQDYLRSNAAREGRPTVIAMPMPTDHPLQREVYGPLGALDENRALLFDGPRMLGRVALTFQSRRRGGLRKPDLLNALVPEIVALFTTAERLQRTEVERPPHLLVSPNGVVDYASAGAERWLTKERRAAIGELVRRADRGELPSVVTLEGWRLAVVRMHGNDVTYLVMLTATPVPELARDHVLTPRQREIAELAVAGATMIEIGATLGLSAATVHDHLKAIYQRLGVGSRAELVAALLPEDAR